LGYFWAGLAICPDKIFRVLYSAIILNGGPEDQWSVVQMRIGFCLLTIQNLRINSNMSRRENLMSDKYLDQLLAEKEKIILVTRQHWLFLLGQIAPELALIFLVIVATSAAWITWTAVAALGYLLLILPLISLGRDVLIWRSNKHVVTTRRVIHMSGVWSKNVTDSSLEKVNDVKMEQSALGRLFTYGDIEILTASEFGVNRFTHIADPIELKTAMLNAKADLDKDDGSAGVMDVPKLIAELGKLNEQGLLTETEFKAKKAELLAKL
jgi:hypothetical protein